MGAFLLAHKSKGDPGKLDAALQAMGRHFLEQGFGKPVLVDGRHYVLRCFPSILGGGTQIVFHPDGRYLACVGTLLFGSSTGNAALSALFHSPDLTEALGRSTGHFTLIAGDGERARILRDGTGALEVFHTADNRFFSSSFLAIAQTLPRRALRKHEALEYIFHGNALGDGCLLADVRRLGFTESAEVAESVRIKRAPFELPPERHTKREVLAREMLASLGETLSGAAQAFNKRLTLALSGGYDTRLLLAACRRQGLSPRIFVYGPTGAIDVRIAGQIAEKEGFGLDRVDKDTSSTAVTQDNYPALVRRNYLDCDGVSYYGIFGSDGEARARAGRHAGGALNLHGAAGEVLRNFFGVTERARSVESIARLFFISDPRMCTPPFSDTAYVQRIAAKMRTDLDLRQPLVSRRAVEALYPYFRCRSWFGRDYSINTRFGHSFMPFYTERMVEAALAVPAALKNFGNFEALMIRLSDAAIASHPSAYGYDFLADVPRARALMLRALQHRPSWLRRALSQAQAALARRPPERVPHEQWAGDLLTLDSAVMRAVVRPDMVRQSVTFPRVCNLAYLVQNLGISDVVD